MGTEGRGYTERAEGEKVGSFLSFQIVLPTKAAGKSRASAITGRGVKCFGCSKCYINTMFSNWQARVQFITSYLLPEYIY